MKVLPLYIYTIYHDPTDYPGKFVTRRAAILPGRIDPDEHPLAVTDSLEHARSVVPYGGASVGRAKQDDPCIVEVWL